MGTPSTAYARHLVRLAASVVIAVATLVLLMAAARVFSRLQIFDWFVLPISVAVGFAPIIRWYGRDAYPIGLIYCPSMFFLLRYLGQYVNQLR